MGSAVLYVRHLERMRTFYAESFQMRTADAADDYCILEADGWTLSLVVVPDAIRGTIDSEVRGRRENVPVKLAFDVASIEGLRPVVAGLHGTIDPSSREWEFRGHVLCDGVDPEGNVIQLVEAIPARR